MDGETAQNLEQQLPLRHSCLVDGYLSQVCTVNVRVYTSVTLLRLGGSTDLFFVEKLVSRCMLYR